MGTTVFTAYVNNDTGFVTSSEVFTGSTVTAYGSPSANQVTY